LTQRAGINERAADGSRPREILHAARNAEARDRFYLSRTFIYSALFRGIPHVAQSFTLPAFSWSFVSIEDLGLHGDSNYLKQSVRSS
jgi:hypothetical protein